MEVKSTMVLKNDNNDLKEITAYPLTSYQRDIWVEQILYPNRSFYNIGGRIEIKGKVDQNILQKAVNYLMKECDALRAVFFEKNGQGYQRFLENAEYIVPIYDFSKEEDPEIYSLNWIDNEMLKPYNIYDNLLFRTYLIKAGEELFYLFYKAHHLVIDGYAFSLVDTRLREIYSMLVSGEEYTSKSVFSYVDFILDNQSYNGEKDRAFWNRKLKDLPEPLITRKTDTQNDGECRITSSRETINIERKTYDNIIQFCETNKCSVFHFFLGVLAVYFCRTYSKTGIVIGVPIVNRKNAKFKSTVGLFVNTIPLIIRVNEGESFVELMQEIRDSLKECYRYQKLNLGEILNEADISFEEKKNIFEITMSYQNHSYCQTFGDYPGLITGLTSWNEKNALSVAIREFDNDNDVKIDLDYLLEVFDDKFSIKNVAEHLVILINKVINHSDTDIMKIDYLSDREKKKILYDFNDTKAEYPKDKTIQQLFEEQVERSPESTAVVFEGRTLSYRELNQMANSLALALREKGVKPDTIVGIMVERSLEMVVGILGILKAGGAYLPLDFEYPEARLKYMLEDSETNILVTQTKIDSKIAFEGQKLFVDDEKIYQNQCENLENLNKADDLAYVIYTSGSTGMPKGAMIKHRGIANLKIYNDKNLEITEKDRVLQFASSSFDASVWEMYMTLLSGAALYIVPKYIIEDFKKFEEFFTENKITATLLPPTYITNLHPENMKTMRTLITGGSVTNFEIFEKWKNHVTYINAYGPTEATICAVTWKAGEIKEGYRSVPIGVPVTNTQIFIVDKNNMLAPIGVAGELCISGAGLGRGYLNRPELTKEKFVENPFISGEKMYRTGDLARWLPDGNIEYLGRIDNQVKVRGFRIELGEIEAQLLKLDKIAEAVVIAKKDSGDSSYLCAYYAAENEMPVQELREALLKELPDYMIPSYFVHLDKLPLTPNGKIDKKALMEYEGEVLNTGVEYVPPTNEVEEKLVQIWQEVLDLERVGINDNFFEIGGHSLKATLLVSRMHKELNIEISLREIFNNPTIHGLAEKVLDRVQSIYSSIVPIEEKDFYPLSAAQKRLFILIQMEEAATSYNMPGIITVEGELKEARLEAAFKALIKRHETLRTSFVIHNEEPVQIISEDIDFNIEYYQGNEKDIDDIAKSFVRPFDLATAPLFRVGLVKFNEERFGILFDMHHIISDGISINTFFREFTELYEGKELEAPRIQYKDFSAWQNNLFTSGAIRSQEEYWQNVFEGEIPVLEFPTDYVRPAVQSFEGDRITFCGDENLSKALNKLAKDTGTTMYMVLLAAYNTVLYRYTGQEDIVVGSPVAGRPHADLDSIIGMFVNTLVMRNYPKGEKTFQEFLKEVKENSLRAYENEDFPFEELVARLNVKRDMSRNPLFDTMLAMQNTDSLNIEIDGIKFSPEGLKNKTSKFDITLSVTEKEGKIFFELEYCTRLFKKERIEKFAAHFMNILSDIAVNPVLKLSALKMLTEEEEKQLIYDFNDTKAEYPKDKTIQQLFEEQVERSPESIAVVFEGRSLSYHELNQRANSLGLVLREKGVKPDTIVGIMVERSLEMIVGIMGILKAGGAYLPISPEYPEDRLKYVLEDSKTGILLTQERFEKQYDFNCEVLNLEDESLYKYDGSNAAIVNKPNDLAYIIYTSGSTGKPKGVMIEHYSVINRLNWMQKKYPIDEKDTILQKTPYTFDVSVWELLWWSLVGARLCFLVPGGEKDPSIIAEAIEKNNITTMHFVPSMLGVFLEHVEEQKDLSSLKSLRQVFASGEALTVQHVERFNNTLTKANKTRLYNLYGPTEATVDVSYFDCPIDGEIERVPIGKPIDNIKLYVVDFYKNLQPIGVKGELWISGDGVSRGYLNKVDLTSEKFVSDPFIEGQIAYRTGDLARWLPDGNIEYLGRIDHQVKIRGNRIELGEIEAQLLKHEKVDEAVVLAKEDESGNKYLCGYYVAEAEIGVAELREHLSKELPDYMIPSYFIHLDKLPLTANGKVDRRALPEPDASISTGAEYVPPTNEVEEKLAEVWQELLGIKRVGINDNFFELGGDSIKAIQMSSRLHKYGMKIEIRDLMRNPNIHDLSKLVKINEANLAEQGIVVGEVSLTPIQKWFFEKNFTGMQHWNQAVMLHGKNGFDEELLKKVFNQILKHHDALRMAYTVGDNNVIQHIRGLNDGELYSLDIVDLRDKENIEEIVLEEASRIQSEMNLNNGPLLKLGLFKTKDGDELLIAVHHLAIDGISWRIIFEDLALGYQQAQDKGNIVFSNKTTSFKEWSLKIQEYADSKKLLKEKDYWKKVTSKLDGHIPVDSLIEERKVKDCKSTGILLTEEETEKLLRGGNRAYNTEINDILLTALGLAIKEWGATDNVAVSLEGHGREDIGAKVDVSRTVGWFTSAYPVVLELKDIEDVSYAIKSVKETLRRIPNKGAGYGILKYLTDKDYTKAINFKNEPEISFNYLGSFGSDLDTGIFSMSKYSSGQPLNPDSEAPFKIDINGMITGNRLSLDFRYHVEEYKTETIEKLAELYKERLVEIIEHCALKEAPELTPSDFADINLEIEELENIKAVYGDDMESIYRLTPMQEGMLYHSLGDSSSTYFEQLSFDIKGELDIGAAAKSIQGLVEKYEVLRTAFMYKGVDRPRQIVLKDRNVPIILKDFSGLSYEDRQEAIESFETKDRETGFDLGCDSLFRVAFFKMDSAKYKIIWSFHHIILDGWCLPIIFGEFFKNYTALVKGEAIGKEEITPYSQYLSWLENQDPEDVKKYWSEYLGGYDEKAVLPRRTGKNAESQYMNKSMNCVFSGEMTAGLVKLAKDQKVTLNTLFETLWGIMLQRYNNTKDVVFGKVVSGRPSEIDGVEKMVGLFINTIPVRVSSDEDMTFEEMLKSIHESAAGTGSFSYYPLAEIQELSELKGQLIDHLIVFENYPLGEVGEEKEPDGGIEIVYDSIRTFEQTNYDFNIVVTPGNEMVIRFNYNALVYKEEMIEAIGGHFKVLAEGILKNPKEKLSKLEILTEKEKERILYGFNATKAEYPKDKTLQQLFEEQVERSPENAAVVFEGRSLSYRELNHRANSLALVLREKGVKPDTIIGIMVERSLEMIVGILGILKAGGAYLPISPDYPEDRLKYVLEDSKTGILLTQERFEKQYDFNCEVLNLEDENLYKYDGSNAAIINKPNDLAYIIYTSGSTGKPKGAMIEHYSVINRLNWMQKKYPIDEKDTILQKTPYTFDVSVWELLWWSLVGAKLCFLVPGGEKDPSIIAEAIEKNSITTMHFVPSMLGVFLEHIEEEKDLGSLRSLRQVFASGEALTVQHVERFNNTLTKANKTRLYNLYGPTEATVDVSYFDCPVDKEVERVPIGKPIDNIKLYVVDFYKNLQPIGVKGELWISGDGVGRGYLNKVDLTSEKFIPDPFVEGKVAYRTGDVARWLPDGNIEYLGRIDHQVKIRGNRIELGEIEAQLLKHEKVDEAVVLAKEDERGSKYLCGYYVSEAEIGVAELREHLSKELPDYMIPSYFIHLDKLPLTSNGKVDRRALPEPDASISTGAEYVSPTNEVEEKLAEVWQELLGIERVGINDNFFELGGDSIKAIQMSSRLHKYGMKIEIRDLMRNPNIQELSKLVKIHEKNLAEQGTVVGEVSLTPIQKWFFEKNFTGMQHWNQAVMLHGKNGFDEELLKKVFNQILKHHDALRMAYVVGDNVKQHNRGLNEGKLYSLDIVDLRDKENIEKIILEEASRIQSEMNLNNGPLVKLGLFKTNEGDELQISVHHLAVDGISWRIIFEDLALGFKQALDKGDIVFSNKTTSFKEWSLKIQEYADSKKLLKEREYWKKATSKLDGHIPVDSLIKERKVKDCKSTGILLTEEETEKLIRGANRAYNTEINDILLTALGMAIKEWAAVDNIAVSLEGHGREDIGAKADVSRTVGWFTSVYPVVLEMKDLENVSYAIKSVKETLRRIPNKGVGYGILKYLTNAEYKKDINFSEEPEISFNYLGSFGSDIDTGVFSMSKYSSGQPLHPDSKAAFKIDINGMITGNKLSMDFRYHVEEYKSETIEKLAELYREKLVEIIEHCALKEAPELTPSDYDDISLEIEELENIKDLYGEEIEKIYRLTPMQEGMLFHALEDSSSSTHFEQLSFDIKGDIDVGLAEKSIQGLGDRYEILRTGFVYKGVDRPRQVVLKERSAPVVFKDISAMKEDERLKVIENFETQDRQTGFDLTSDSLLRVALLKIDTYKYKIIWSFHHIILDGWCMPIIFGDFFKNYTALVKGEALSKEEVTPYGQYLSWLENQDPEEVKKYWSEYLGGYDEKAVVPRRSVKNVESQYMNKSMNCVFSKEMTAGLVKLAKDQKVTLNTLFETLWGIMLQRYNNTKDVVFGKVVSGRPSEIVGVEKMVGLFINTIPVRASSDEDMTFEEMLKSIHEIAALSGKYSYSPLVEIQELSELKGQLIDHLIVFENYPLGEAGDDNGVDSSIEIVYDSIKAFEQTNYDLNIVVTPGIEIVIRFNYNALAYEEEMIKAIGEHFKVLAESILKNPKEKLSKLEILTEKEKKKILYDFNDTKAGYPKDKTIQQLFEEQVERSPESTAVVFEGRTFSYHELNQRANSLALVLREKGVKPDTIVGIMVERSLEMIVGILGILKAGGAYLPLDLEYPEARLKYMLEDSGTNILVTQSKIDSKIAFEGQKLFVDDEKIYQNPCENLENLNTTDDIAYVIYTSGSTGMPKGAMIKHRGIANLKVYNDKNLEITEEDRVLQFANSSFDASVWEMYMTLLSGASLYIVPKYIIEDFRKFEEFFTENKITATLLPPTYIINLHPENMKTMTKLITGGSATNFEIFEKWKNHVKYINAYGPTEATICAVTWKAGEIKESYRSVPIGVPLTNTQIFIVDKNNMLAPINVAGELCISGAGLGRGYLNRPELTKEKFVENPFISGEKMYRTGDLAKWLPDGNIEFLGRMDNQVKVRGFRIELGEIEAQLLKLDKISEAVVIAKKDSGDSSYLCAYYTAENEMSVQELREALLKELPDYMIPAYFVHMDKMPLTPNGKIDKKALMEHDGKVLNTGVEYVPPTNEVEETLAQIWQEVLDLERVGINDNFFEIGGHSLKATLLVSKIHKELNIEIPLRELFKEPTIKGIARFAVGRRESLYSSIAKTEEKPYYPLSAAQKRLYILSQLEGTATSYNIPSILMVEGDLEAGKLEAAFKALIERHETMRTSFEIVDNEAMQKIVEAVEFNIEYHQGNEENIDEIVKEFVSPFDLAKAPLLRVGLVKISKDKHIMLFDMHHIISDGMSMSILIREFTGLYEGKELEASRIQYKDFSAWQNHLFATGAIRSQEEYWENVFEEEIPVLEMPADYTRPAIQSFEGDRITFFGDENLSKALNKLAKDTGATMYMVLLAAYNTMLYRYTGQEDIVVGSPVAGRPHADLRGIIGMFVNTLAMRNYPKGEKTFQEFLMEVKENSLGAYENQDYPFEELVERLNVKRDMSRNPLFDTMLTMQNTDSPNIEIAGLKFSPEGIKNKTSKFDITLTATEEAGKIFFELEYCTRLFKKERMERFAEHFMNILSDIAVNPVLKLSDIKMLKEEEEKQLLYDFNDTKAEYPRNKTIQQIFEEQVNRNPEGIAVVFEDKKLSYSELNQKANNLAKLLREKGVKADTIVGIMVERSLEMVIGILGILKAGGAYLPIDPYYPKDRINYTLENSQTKILLTEKSMLDGVDFEGTILFVEDEEVYKGSGENLPIINNPSNLAYIIYTSGTTGKPKGAMIEHRNVVRLMFNDKIQFDFNEKDVWTMFHSFCFDFSVWEMYGALLYGGKLVVVPRFTAKDALSYLKLLKAEKVTVLNQTPTSFYGLAEEELKMMDKELVIRYVIFGGEALKPIMLKGWKEKYPLTRLINMYGITETTVHVTYKEIGNYEIDENVSNIGKPIPTLTTYIMDKNLKLLPLGATGELCVGGDGVGRGYLNNLELTTQKFVENPYNKEERLYRSGDLARLLPNGDMEYLGRIDQQVKIRGFRIELGEIETELLRHEDIKETIVLAKEDESGNKYLCGYYVADTEISVTELRERLSKELPDYMIPSYFIHLDKLPLTSNGKVDRRALPEPDASINIGAEYVPPSNEVEEKVAEVWQEVLGIDKVGINDNFFELGGHSLKAAIIINKINKAFDSEIAVTSIFENQTVSTLAKVVDEKEKQKIELEQILNEIEGLSLEDIELMLENDLGGSKNNE